ncbi:hypothetical protein NO559_07755 [Dasania sp. GY-MA-18]|uniref:Cadherin domain-containing protein n=1 Tax=Dasania phycosphaerae TaxID=2950436 RepID=A0A9J6RKR5_9GAMM|nr:MULTISPECIES: hypothetical protein [Dasania]MCR8922661.1 hypothetical protein [Dasania sp. GY-MA-18]MCZ0865091.1 hypothetical protein [Dasania phycosphaerae]MCZ0868817.1 hypothetical protein [Dasania phycosphaerae]
MPTLIDEHIVYDYGADAFPAITLTAAGANRLYLCVIIARHPNANSGGIIAVGAENADIIYSAGSTQGGQRANITVGVFNGSQLSAGATTFTTSYPASNALLYVAEMEGAPQASPYGSVINVYDLPAPSASSVVASGNILNASGALGISLVAAAGNSSMPNIGVSAHSANFDSYYDNQLNTNIRAWSFKDYVIASNSESYTATIDANGDTITSLLGLFFAIGTVSTPVSIIGSISDSAPAPSDVVTLNISNGTGPYTATLDGVAVTLTEVVADAQYTFVTPNPMVWDDKTRTFNTAYNFVITDANSVADSVSLQITPAHQYTQAAGEPWQQGVSVLYGSGAVDGDWFACEWTQGGDGKLLNPDGSVHDLSIGNHILQIAIFDGVSWGDISLVPYDINAPGTAPTMPADAAVNIIEGVISLGYFTALSGAEPITYTLSGADAAKCTLDANTGALSLVDAAVLSDVINITITASNGTTPDASQNITFTVIAAVLTNTRITPITETNFAVANANEWLSPIVTDVVLH